MNRVLLLAVLLLSIEAHAQSGGSPCPPGMIPGASRCYGPNELPQQSNSPYTYTGPLWQDRYGAVAESDSTSAAGSAQNMSTARAAQKKAMSECGAKDCRIRMQVRNGCLASAWGGGVSGFVSRGNLQAAEADAISNCQRKGGADCKIQYSACSLPVRIR